MFLSMRIFSRVCFREPLLRTRALKSHAKEKGGFKGGIFLLHSAYAVRLVVDQEKGEGKKAVRGHLAGTVVGRNFVPV